MYVARMVYRKRAYRVLVKKSERKRSLGRTKHRGEKIIQLNFKK